VKPVKLVTRARREIRECLERTENLEKMVDREILESKDLKETPAWEVELESQESPENKVLKERPDPRVKTETTVLMELREIRVLRERLLLGPLVNLERRDQKERLEL